MAVHRRSILITVALFAACGPRNTPSLSPIQPPPAGEMFDSVAAVLERHFYDTVFARTVLKELREEFRPAAARAETLTEERDVIWRFLARIPASHLALMSWSAWRALRQDVDGRPRVMSGLALVRIDGRFHASMILAGSPAVTAGIRDGDVILTVNGTEASRSPHLDWRSDDAFLRDEHDPPVHELRGAEGDTLRLQLWRAPGETLSVRLVPQPYSALEAARASARVIPHDGIRIGYIRLWFVHSRGLGELLRAALIGPLQSSEVLVLDLRGRGGSAAGVQAILRLLEPGIDQRFVGPVVALIDRRTRSAKEILAHQLRSRGLARLVGEPTAGALLLSAFADVGVETVLMYPSDVMPVYTDLIEGHPVAPDVDASSAAAHFPRVDRLLDAALDEAARIVRDRGPGIALLPRMDTLRGRMITAYGGDSAVRRFPTVSGTGAARSWWHQQGDSSRHSSASLDSALSIGEFRLTRADSSALDWRGLLLVPFQVVTDHRTAKVEGIELFDGAPCIRIRFGATKPSSELLVEVATFLPRGLRFFAGVPGGMTAFTVRYKAYRPVAGLLIPWILAVEAGNAGAELQLDRIVQH